MKHFLSEIDKKKDEMLSLFLVGPFSACCQICEFKDMKCLSSQIETDKNNIV